MVVWSSLVEARRCLNGESSCKYEVLLSFEDRELPYREGVWVASRLCGFINISDRSELPRHMRKWHWSWVKVGLAREVSDWSRVSHICWLDLDATAAPQLEYISDPAHRHLGRSLVFRSLKCLVVPRSAKTTRGIWKWATSGRKGQETRICPRSSCVCESRPWRVCSESGQTQVG